MPRLNINQANSRLQSIENKSYLPHGVQTRQNSLNESPNFSKKFLKPKKGSSFKAQNVYKSLQNQEIFAESKQNYFIERNSSQAGGQNKFINQDLHHSLQTGKNNSRKNSRNCSRNSRSNSRTRNQFHLNSLDLGQLHSKNNLQTVKAKHQKFQQKMQKSFASSISSTRQIDHDNQLSKSFKVENDQSGQIYEKPSYSQIKQSKTEVQEVTIFQQGKAKSINSKSSNPTNQHSKRSPRRMKTCLTLSVSEKRQGMSRNGKRMSPATLHRSSLKQQKNERELSPLNCENSLVDKKRSSTNFTSNPKTNFNLKKMIGPFEKRMSVVEKKREIEEKNKQMIKKLVQIKLGNTKYNQLIDIIQNQPAIGMKEPFKPSQKMKEIQKQQKIQQAREAQTINLDMSNYSPDLQGQQITEGASIFRTIGGRSQHNNSRANPHRNQQMMLMSSALKQQIPKSQNQQYRRRNMTVLGSVDHLNPQSNYQTYYDNNFISQDLQKEEIYDHQNQNIMNSQDDLVQVTQKLQLDQFENKRSKMYSQIQGQRHITSVLSSQNRQTSFLANTPIQKKTKKRPVINLGLNQSIAVDHLPTIKDTDTPPSFLEARKIFSKSVKDRHSLFNRKLFQPVLKK